MKHRMPALQAVQERTIQLDADPFAGMVDISAAPARKLDAALYPGAEFFGHEVALRVIDGFKPDSRTSAAAGKLQKLMKTAAEAEQAIVWLDQAVGGFAKTVGILGDQLKALLPRGDQLPS
eukprot:SAG31_NODE_15494_length_752_cov_1.145482_2_plen_120_part_01